VWYAGGAVQSKNQRRRKGEIFAGHRKIPFFAAQLLARRRSLIRSAASIASAALLLKLALCYSRSYVLSPGADAPTGVRRVAQSSRHPHASALYLVKQVHAAQSLRRD
jgi:hypothetical protein